MKLTFTGNLTANEVLAWIIQQKIDESIIEVSRIELEDYIETQDFLAIVFCK